MQGTRLRGCNTAKRTPFTKLVCAHPPVGIHPNDPNVGCLIGVCVRVRVRVGAIMCRAGLCVRTLRIHGPFSCRCAQHTRLTHASKQGGKDAHWHMPVDVYSHTHKNTRTHT